MKYEISLATGATMDQVEEWLDAEEHVYQHARSSLDKRGDEIPIRGFRCNWDTARQNWEDGKSRVDILLIDGEAIGFLDGTDILEIKPNKRRKGYGRLLAKHMIDLATEDGQSVIEIEIAPASAKPFWERIGFTAVEGRRGPGRGIYAYRILSQCHGIAEGKPVPYVVEFFTERERYEDSPNPFVRYQDLGVQLEDKSVQLPERAICFDPSHDQHIDYFVRIELDSQELLFEKVKRESSRKCGVQMDSGYVYYVDRILKPTIQ